MEKNRAYLVLIGCCFLTACVHGIEGGTMGNFILPISYTFGMTISSISAYITIKGIALVVAIPLVNYAITRFNIKYVLFIAGLVYSCVLFALSFSENLIQLYGFAILQGISSSFFSTVAVPLLIQGWFKKNHSIFLGIAFAASGIAGALISPVITQVISAYGWRFAYKILALFEVSVLVPAILILIRRVPRGHNSFAVNEEPILNKTKLKIEGKMIYRDKSFLLLMIYGSSLALSNGFFFIMPSLTQNLGHTAILGARLVSFCLLGATLGKIIFGFLNVHLSVNRVTLIAGVSGGLGIILIFTRINHGLLPFVGALLYGFLVSLMTLEPPLIVKKTTEIHFQQDVFVFVSMIVQLSYVLGPVLYSLIYDSTQSYWMVITVNFALIFISIFSSEILLTTDVAKENI